MNVNPAAVQEFTEALGAQGALDAQSLEFLALLSLELGKAVVGSDENFQLSLRLLDCLIHYDETKDPRILLRLPTEERSIASSILDRTAKRKLRDHDVRNYTHAA